jgi:hypothetical protein
MEAILAFLWENVFVEGMLIVKRLAVFFDVSGGIHTKLFVELFLKYLLSLIPTWYAVSETV